MPAHSEDDESIDWPAIGRAVYDRRVEQGMERQQDLADRAGVHVNTVSRIERGTPSTRRNPTWPKIETALGWPAGHIARLAEAHGAAAARLYPIPEGLAGEIRDAVREAVSVIEPDVTVRQAREIAEAAVAELRRRDLLPPDTAGLTSGR